MSRATYKAATRNEIVLRARADPARVQRTMRPSHLLLWRSSEAGIRELFLFGVRRESSKAGSHLYLGIRDA